MTKRESEVIFVRQNLNFNRLTDLVHATSTVELISFGFNFQRSLSPKFGLSESLQSKWNTDFTFGLSLVSVRI